jgi:putative ABC transport system permease protein
MFRRKLRSSLTIFGTSIGVFMLVVLGAFAEKANVTVDSGTEYYETRVIIAEAKDVNSFGMPSGNRPLSIKKIDEIKRIQGVRDVAPQVSMLLEANPQVTGGSPSLLLGGYMGTDRTPEEWRFSSGQGFSEAETRVAVVGPDLVRTLHAQVGRRISIRGVEFKVVGILDRSFTIFNQSVMIPFPDARELYADSLPRAVRNRVDRDDLATNFLAYTTTEDSSDAVAERINREVKGVKASGAMETKKAVGQLLDVIGAIMLGVGSIGLLIGGLSIVNTMTMSVLERTREIGIKRAMGASTGRIMREVLAEAAAMSGLGGFLGIGAGMLAVLGINSATAPGWGTVLFMVTARLVIGTAGFAIALGVLAGIYPARRAAHMNPTAALGYE